MGKIDDYFTNILNKSSEFLANQDWWDEYVKDVVKDEEWKEKNPVKNTIEKIGNNVFDSFNSNIPIPISMIKETSRIVKAIIKSKIK